jgi:hypothetical protein
MFRLTVLALTLAILTSGCASYNVKHLAKDDVNMVSDVNRQTVSELIYSLMAKLYRRNPRELNKQVEPTIASQVARLQSMVVKEQALRVDGLEGVVILRKGFDPHFKGDRVFQLMAGLMSMIHKSYGYRSDFYIFDSLGEEKLYNSARNLEIFSWRLRNTKGAQGETLLLSVAVDGPFINLSYERLLGKMIALQDMMSLIAADGGRRTINSVAHGIISMVFIPI